MLNKQILLDYMNSQWGRRLVYAIALLFILLSLFSVYNFLKTFLIVTDRAVEQPIKQEEPLKKLPDIANWHLFGLYQPELSQLPTAEVNLKLVGVFTAVPEKYSQVIIAVPDGEEKVYKVGDELPGGAKVYRILEDSVIIEYEGSLQRLSLPKQSIEFGTMPPKLNFKESQ